MFNYIGMYLVIEGVKAFIYDSAGARSQTSKIAVPKMGLNHISQAQMLMVVLLLLLHYASLLILF